MVQEVSLGETSLQTRDLSSAVIPAQLPCGKHLAQHLLVSSEAILNCTSILHSN